MLSARFHFAFGPPNGPLLRCFGSAIRIVFSFCALRCICRIQLGFSNCRTKRKQKTTTKISIFIFHKYLRRTSEHENSEKEFFVFDFSFLQRRLKPCHRKIAEWMRFGRRTHETTIDFDHWPANSLLYEFIFAHGSRNEAM